MIIFINDGNYSYKYDNHEIVLRKQKKYVMMDIFNKKEIKQYRVTITEEQLSDDEYFQSIKTEYNVLHLFGLTNVELFTILVDNSIKKNTYQIEWFKITPLNIKNDKIKFNGIIYPSLELSLSFTLDFLTYI
jgi:hypothetical protein